MQNQRGSVTVLALVTMTFIGIILAGLLPMSSNELKIGTLNKDMIEAQYAAEAGAKRAIVEFNQGTPDLSWINGNIPFTDDVTKKRYNVIIYLASDNTKTPVPFSNLTSGNTYVIQSAGTVGKTTKNVSVTINVPSSDSGGVFSKYTTYSKGTLTVDNTPKITGDIGSGNSITVNSSTPLIYGTAYTPNVPVFNQWSWNKDAVTGGYKKPTSEDSLSVDIPAILPATYDGTGTSLPSNGWKYTNTVASGNYYYNNSLSLGQGNVKGVSGQSVSIYINGNLDLNNAMSITADNLIIYAKGNINLSDAKISGKNVTIYAGGQINMNGTSSITQSSSGGSVKINTQSSLQMTNTATINSDSVFINAQSSINFNSNSSINSNSSTAIAKVYSSGPIEFTNSFTMGGSAGLVETSRYINLNSNQNSINTVFISGSGSSEITNSVKLAGFYTNGSLRINSSPTVTYNASVIDTLGLGGNSGASSLPVVSNWTIF